MRAQFVSGACIVYGGLQAAGPYLLTASSSECVYGERVCVSLWEVAHVIRRAAFCAAVMVLGEAAQKATLRMAGVRLATAGAADTLEVH